MSLLSPHVGLGIALALLLLIEWAVQAWTGWRLFPLEPTASGHIATGLFSTGKYGWGWASTMLASWQLELVQLTAFVVLTGYVIHRAVRSPATASSRARQRMPTAAGSRRSPHQPSGARFPTAAARDRR
jgi:hypothetical protein